MLRAAGDVHECDGYERHVHERGRAVAGIVRPARTRLGMSRRTDPVRATTGR